MQVQNIRFPHTSVFLFLFAISLLPLRADAQVSSVEFGKNRLQFKKLNWQYRQTPNFNVYFYEGGDQLSKYVLQIAEEELPGLERYIEYSLQLRGNIMVYNSYDDMKQSNIGLGTEVQEPGGTTVLVNNKMIIYFNGNHADLRRQVRQGIAKILTQNLLFGDDLGEMAGNQALLDLPEWLVDGYIAYAAENWSPGLDDDLKSEILSYKYKNFYQFVFDKPLLAGHAFWFYIEEQYGRENTTYLLYLARMYKSLSRAATVVTKVPKFKSLLRNFMTYQEEKYEEDIRRRKNIPKGSQVTSETITRKKDYYNFDVNPNRRNLAFTVVEYKKGQYRLILDENGDRTTLLKIGAKSRMGDINPNYPLTAWDPKGSRLAVAYEEEGRLQLFVFDAITRVKPYKRELTGKFDQIQSMAYIYNDQNLLLSAVKNGKTDIFIYDLENETVKRVTDDVYDNLDASFVAFPNKSGILFSSNRPSAAQQGADTSLMMNRFNIFMVTDFAPDKPELNQITQLTDMEWGDARYPTQYNDNHFTFISDANGVMNRYAGFFTTQRAGVDTLVLIDQQVLRNPDPEEIDSLLRVLNKQDVDSIAIVALSQDSAYAFPLTNYASGVRETTSSGAERQVSEVTRQSDEKILYKLKIDENTLRRRNVTARPTRYMEKLMERKRLAEGERVVDRTREPGKDIFQQEFEVTPQDTMKPQYTDPDHARVLFAAKLFPYKPLKFSADYVTVGFNNNVLGTKFQPYQHGQGPIQLSSQNNFNGMIRVGVADLMEDIRLSGGLRLGTNLKDNEWMLQFSNMRKRVDWGLLYYKSVLTSELYFGEYQDILPARIFSNLYQGTVSYPFDVVRSVRVTGGLRQDKTEFAGLDPVTLGTKTVARKYALLRAEYVHDNTINPTMNIWDGLRFKVYADFNSEVTGNTTSSGRSTFNLGFDGRVYKPIYRNFIWAGRVAGDYSWGDQKFIYYLGGIDNWLMFGDNRAVGGARQFRFFNENNRPAPDVDYAFQTLAGNLRGFVQNAANGNNNFVINSEFRLPVFSTLFSKPINNAFLRNFQIIQFVDLGTAWNGQFNSIGRPEIVYTDPNDENTVRVRIKAPGIGPFLGGYGFGARSTLLGYFLKVDAGWPMSGFFDSKPIIYVSMGVDF